MKSLTNYIKSDKSSLISLSEKLIINKNYTTPYSCAPASFKELRQIIEDRYKEQGFGTKDEPIDFNDINVSNVDTFYDNEIGLFESTKFKYIDLSYWDVSNVKNMLAMFIYCEELKSIGDISNWDVSNVKNMGAMFYDCRNLTSIGNLSNWNVLNVKHMYCMFKGCEQLKSVGDLSKWNVSSVKDMRNVFYGSAIENIPSWYKG